MNERRYPGVFDLKNGIFDEEIRSRSNICGEKSNFRGIKGDGCGKMGLKKRF
jgi:hypothetical protein